MNSTLLSMHRYHAWANRELFEKLEAIDPISHTTEIKNMIRILNHCNVVSRIFKGHLTRIAHGFHENNTVATPTLAELAADLCDIDAWYADFLASTSEQTLDERVSFTFTDGDSGGMTGAEIVTHIILHGGYHRGEVGRILRSIGAALPWDTYAVHLHQAEPGRRGAAAA